MADEEVHWFTEDECGENIVFQILQTLIMIKAIVIIIACLLGIRFYCKSKFLHFSVVLCLLAAIVVVSSLGSH